MTGNEFSGPLEILLSLVEEKELPISEISLSEVTDQYLAYLDSVEERRPDELADFLVVAARLLYIKSRTLLPELAADDDDGVSLEHQLRLYQRFVAASHEIEARWESTAHSYVHTEPKIVPEEAVCPSNFTAAALVEAMRALIARIKPPPALPETFIDKTISLKACIDSLRKLLKAGKTLSFFETCAHGGRTDTVVNFLALLELVKTNAAGLTQKAFGKDITIRSLT